MKTFILNVLSTCCVMSMEWFKGIIGSAVVLGIISLLAYIFFNYSWFSAFVSATCMIFSIIGVLSLIYAIEEDSFAKGFLVPIFFTFVGVIGYYWVPPGEETTILCILGSVLAFIIASAEGS